MMSETEVRELYESFRWKRDRIGDDAPLDHRLITRTAQVMLAHVLGEYRCEEEELLGPDIEANRTRFREYLSGKA